MPYYTYIYRDINNGKTFRFMFKIYWDILTSKHTRNRIVQAMNCHITNFSFYTGLDAFMHRCSLSVDFISSKPDVIPMQK